jgi:hypothetical protein
VLVADPAPAPEYFCQQPRAPSLPFSPPPRARLALWRVMAGGVWGTRAWWCVCGGCGILVLGAVVVVACSCSTSRATLVCRFGNVGALYAATPRDRPSCLGAPVQCTGPVSVQLGSGSYYASCPSWPHHGRAGRSRRSTVVNPAHTPHAGISLISKKIAPALSRSHIACAPALLGCATCNANVVADGDVPRRYGRPAYPTTGRRGRVPAGAVCAGRGTEGKWRRARVGVGGVGSGGGGGASAPQPEVGRERRAGHRVG